MLEFFYIVNSEYGCYQLQHKQVADEEILRSEKLYIAYKVSVYYTKGPA
jgi:hypothetical protein